MVGVPGVDAQTPYQARTADGEVGVGAASNAAPIGNRRPTVADHRFRLAPPLVGRPVVIQKLEGDFRKRRAKC